MADRMGRQVKHLATLAITLALTGCISTDLTSPDGTTVHRVAFATTIGSIHATSTKQPDGTYAIVVDEQAVDQTTAFANAMQAMAAALNAAMQKP